MTSYTNLLNSFWQKIEDQTFEGQTDQQKNDTVTKIISILNECGLMDICSKCDYLSYAFPKLESTPDTLTNDSDDPDYSDSDSAAVEDEEGSTSETSSESSSSLKSESSSSKTLSSSSSSSESSATTNDPEFISYSDLFNLFALKLKHTTHVLLFGDYY